jgi:hypothetical protein
MTMNDYVQPATPIQQAVILLMGVACFVIWLLVWTQPTEDMTQAIPREALQRVYEVRMKCGCPVCLDAAGVPQREGMR